MNKGLCSLFAVFLFLEAAAGAAAQPYDRDFYHLRAQQYMMQGNLSAALEVYNLLIGTDPGDQKAFNGRGVVFERRGDLNNALSDFERALAMNPQYAEAFHNREALMQKYKNERPSTRFAPQGVAPNRMIPPDSGSQVAAAARSSDGLYSDAFPVDAPAQTRPVTVRPAAFPKTGAAASNAAGSKTAGTGGGGANGGSGAAALAENWKPVEQKAPVSLSGGAAPVIADTGYGAESGYLPPSRYPPPATAARVDGNPVRVSQSYMRLTTRPADAPAAVPAAPPQTQAQAARQTVVQPARSGSVDGYGWSVTSAAPPANVPPPDSARLGQPNALNAGARFPPMLLTQNPPVARGLGIPVSAAQEHNIAGLAFYQAGNYEQAAASFNEAVKASPDFTIAYNNRGAAYAQMGKYQNAMDDFNQALRLNPYYYDAQFNREIMRPIVSR